jgi:hypothetical protein
MGFRTNALYNIPLDKLEKSIKLVKKDYDDLLIKEKVCWGKKAFCIYAKRRR